MANMTFKTNLLPDNTGGQKALGSATAKWAINGNNDPKLTDTTYSAGTGISISGTTISNSGVRSVTINGNALRVNTNGTNADLTIPFATNATNATNATKATKANLTTTANSIAYFTDTTGTFGYKASANGALYAKSENGALQWGILPIVQGGSGADGYAPGTGDISLAILSYMNGVPLYTDPTFLDGTCSIVKYNNQSAAITVTRNTYSTFSIIDPGTNSSYVLKISIPGQPTAPGLGGFYQAFTAKANTTFVEIFRALLPTGYSFNVASNGQGDSYQRFFVTPTAGTGRWEWYAVKTICGKTGTFSTGGHIYITKTTTGDPTYPVNFYLSYCNIFDITQLNINSELLRARKNGTNYYGILTPAGADNEWIRATTLGFIPYSSNSTDGVGGLGTSSWPWKTAYIKTIYGTLKGTADIASKLGTATLGSGTKPIYLSSGTATECNTYAGGTAVTLNESSKAGSTASFYAPTTSGTVNTQALVSGGSGAGVAPKWVNISPSINFTDLTTSTPKISVTVLNQTGNANIPIASTSAYGVTQLVNSTASTSTTTAATPNSVKAAYDSIASGTANHIAYYSAAHVISSATNHLYEANLYNIKNTTGGADLGYKITGKNHTTAFMIESGNENRGIYELTTNNTGWLLYWGTDNNGSHSYWRVKNPTANDTTFKGIELLYTPNTAASGSNNQTYRLRPISNKELDLGDSSHYWKNLYIDGSVQRAGKSVSWYQGRNAALIKTTSYSGYDAAWSLKTTDGDWAQGVHSSNTLYWTYITDTNYTNNSNTKTASMSLDTNGNLTTNTFTGYLNGRAKYVDVTDTAASSTTYYINFTAGKAANTSYSVRASDCITTTNGNLTIFKNSATATSVRAGNSVTNVELHAAASGNRGVYDSKLSAWLIYRTYNSDGAVATTYIPDWASIGASNRPVYLNSSGRPTGIGTLAVTYGGTGSSSQTASRVVYTNSSGNITSGYHYVDSTHFAICSTSQPSTTLYVNGTANFTGNVSISNSAASLILDDTGRKAKVLFTYNGFQGKYYGTAGVDAPATVYINNNGGDITIGKNGYRTLVNSDIKLTQYFYLKSGKTYGTSFPPASNFPDSEIPAGIIFFKKI